MAEIKRTIYTVFCLFNLRLEFSHNAIEIKIYYELATTLYYFLNNEGKRIDRQEVIGVAKGGGGEGSGLAPQN